MSEAVVEPIESIDQKAKKAVLNMNTKLREQGFNERERAFMWGMTVSELRVFLNTIWEHMHNDVEKQLDKLEDKLDKIEEKPVPKPPKNKLGTDE